LSLKPSNFTTNPNKLQTKQPNQKQKKAPHIGLALAGVDVITNGSGSHHALRKLRARLDLILGATAKGGGVYLYANQRGCDGGRLYYDGCACVASNGALVAMGAQFGVGDVEVVPATVDLDEVVSYRLGLASLREQASAAPAPAVVRVPGFALCRSGGGSGSGGGGAARLSLPMEPRVCALLSDRCVLACAHERFCFLLPSMPHLNKTNMPPPKCTKQNKTPDTRPRGGDRLGPRRVAVGLPAPQRRGRLPAAAVGRRRLVGDGGHRRQHVPGLCVRVRWL
jgi:hypothetical protein